MWRGISGPGSGLCKDDGGICGQQELLERGEGRPRVLPGPSPKPNGGGREGLGRLGTAQAAGCRGWGPGGVVGGEGFFSGPL